MVDCVSSRRRHADHGAAWAAPDRSTGQAAAAAGRGRAEGIRVIPGWAPGGHAASELRLESAGLPDLLEAWRRRYAVENGADTGPLRERPADREAGEIRSRRARPHS